MSDSDGRQCCFAVLFQHWLNATTSRYDIGYCTRSEGHAGHHTYEPYPRNPVLKGEA